jgi:hypothetical protein
MALSPATPRPRGIHSWTVFGRPQSCALVGGGLRSRLGHYRTARRAGVLQRPGARAAEPVLANEALDRIGAIYKVEEDIRARKLSGEQDFSGHHLLCIRSRDIGIDARAIFGTSIHARCHMVSILIPLADDWDRKNP